LQSSACYQDGVRVVERALIVEGGEALSGVLEAFARSRAAVVHIARTEGVALQTLRATPVDAALVDLSLLGGGGRALFEQLWRQSAMPEVVVISRSVTPAEAFELAQAGVRGFVAEPLSLERLAQAWDEAMNRPPDIRPFVRSIVGQVSLRDVEEIVRRSMTEEALARAGSSRRRASGLLGISRQLLQHILRGQIS
jgi:two-component system response regulator RegA